MLFQMRVSKGLPGSPAYKATGEIDPKRKSSPPKEIVNKIKNNIESPSKMGSANKPRCTYNIHCILIFFRH